MQGAARRPAGGGERGGEESRLTAASHVENPYCGCRLTAAHVQAALAFGSEAEAAAGSLQLQYLLISLLQL